MEDPKLKLKQFFIVCFLIMAMGTFGFMATEGLSLADAFYFSIVTIATVGYGDIHPTSTIGKVLAIFLIIGGVGTFLGVIANATDILMNRRDNIVRIQKRHMVISIFFSEVGTKLLSLLTLMDGDLNQRNKSLLIDVNWSGKNFEDAKKTFSSGKISIRPHPEILEELRELLKRKSDVLLRLIENPNLLEHESFTDLIMSIIHTRDELLHRNAFHHLPESDYAHIANDIKRTYRFLVPQWLDHLDYLKNNYPYLFHLSIRSNPFNPDASVIIEDH